MQKNKILRITTIPISLKTLLKGQHRFMSKNGFEVIGVSSFGKELQDVEQHETIRVAVLEMTRMISPFNDLKSLWEFYALCKRERPTIVHSHTPKAGIVGMLGAKLAGVPVRLHTVAGMPLMEAKGIKRKLLDVIEKLIGDITVFIRNQNKQRMPDGIKSKILNLEKILETQEEIIEIGKRTTIDLGIHGLHPELIRMVGKMKYRSSYGQNLLQHSREVANLCATMAAELGLNPKKAKRAGLLHDIGKVPDDEPELPHAILGMRLCEKYKEKPDICNAVGAHHDEVEMETLIAPIVQVCDAISGARPGARREIVEAYIKRLNDLENLALSYPGVLKTYAIQAGRELRVIVGADKIDDKETELLSFDIAKKIQDEMTYPGQVKITVIRETRAVSYAK